MSAVVLVPELVLPGPSADTLRSGAAVVVAGSRIAAIDTPEVLAARFPDAETIALPDCLVMPGLVNAHQHGRGLSQIQLGYHDDYLETWIAGRRGRGILDSFAITRLAAARMVMQGVTATVHANYSYGTGDYEGEVRAQLAAYDAVGLRVAMAVGAMDRGATVYPPHEACFMAGLPDALRDWLSRPGAKAYAGDAEGTIALMDRLLADYGTHPRVRLCYGPAGPQWVSDALWAALARDANDKGLGLQFHALESPAQRDAATELYPEGVFARLDALGAMGPRTVVAHGVWPSEADMAIMARTGATVVRNPGCNVRMRNGIAPVSRYLAAGVRLAVGTDNCAMQDDEDLLAELRLAGLLAREPDWNGPAPPSTDQLLAMATTNGAVAAGFSPDTGTLAPGRAADLIALSLTRTRAPWIEPDMPLMEAVIARAHGTDVRLTMIDGRIVFRDGSLVGQDLAEIEAAAVASAQGARRPKDPANRDYAARLRGHLCSHYQRVAVPRRPSDRTET
ncbi:amidohydrolase family protein [Rhodoplanes sp. TEM]|uniref:Amidohydrolase family protein n=1 Tax=Rhodoplanes tepidamans TaxID=200616 RepID=A0ABT5J7V7_RHOTP|nr:MULTISPECIES: amidohydrolase family protein [Rhodoplanes]MDC7785598.1 amidohydrolase family protein [Rhodoplanes tepidamans]MDC7985699.1 amidohydrolase family protein [Rhodoplanes sp. TEM]MDQ0354836.1 cytosine/adenosine deaminase-related metal-dependent hydrolase [Rhodoplanes tepidamans]